MKKKEITQKDKKQMAKDRGVSMEYHDELLSYQPAPSTSDSLSQNIREDEDTALTSIHMQLFRQETQCNEE